MQVSMGQYNEREREIAVVVVVVVLKVRVVTYLLRIHPHVD
jgi:hypothetical protein